MIAPAEFDLARSQGSSMRTGLNLKPGDKGTRRLVAEYGERLVRVRYRSSPEKCSPTLACKFQLRVRGIEA
jgi:hypothetical protein